MQQLVGSFYLLGTLAFVLVSALVGVRLCLLSRRTGKRPELYLGLGILGAAVLGYGPMIAAVLIRGEGESTTLTAGLSGLGKVIHDVGVTMILLFVVTVFRSGSRGAWALFAVAMVLLWGGLAGVGWTTRFHDLLPSGPAWWAEFSVIWTYPLWPAFESFRYHGLMKKRQRLGMADPLVVDRFRLWGFASLGTLGAVIVSSSPMLMEPELAKQLRAPTYIVTAVFGIFTVTLYSLTFFPPRWYRQRVESAAVPEAA